MKEIVEKRVPGKVHSMSLADYVHIIREKPLFSLLFPLIILAVIVVGFGIATDGAFFGMSVLKGIFNQALILATVSTAMSFVFTAGNMDISVGSAMCLAAVLGAFVYNATNSVPLMVLVCVVLGVVFMSFNGLIHALFGVRTIIISIVMMQLYNAIVSVILGPDTVSVDYGLCRRLENAGFRNIAFVIFFLVCIVLFHWTAIGRKLKFVGGNARCAQQTGIRYKSIVMLSFVIAGLGVGLSAVFSIIRTSTVGTTLGSGMGMDVMLAVVLGGMSVFGGARSNAYAGLLGAVTVTALNKGLLMCDVSPMVIQGIRGVVFLILVYLNSERPATLPSSQD